MTSGHLARWAALGSLASQPGRRNQRRLRLRVAHRGTMIGKTMGALAGYERDTTLSDLTCLAQLHCGAAHEVVRFAVDSAL